MKSERIYLDNAATSWPKPPSVYDAVDHYQRVIGAPAGRSNYAEADDVQRIITDARQRLAALVDAESSEQIVFTFNGTDALNLALHGCLREEDHVITTVVEHNSVLRPLHDLRQNLHVATTYIPCDRWGVIDPDDVRRAIQPRTRLVALSHASNVTGALQPVQQIGQIARQSDLIFLVDAAQTVGHLPLSVRQLGAHLLAAPAHKGLLSPLGTGFLYVDPEVQDQMRPLRQGGTGTQSDVDEQPESMPDKFEAGNHNMSGITGLAAALTFLQERTVEAIRKHDVQLSRQLLDGLLQIPGITVHGPDAADQRVGVVSITIDGYDPREVASLLDSSYNIQVRSGIHCAPRMHQALGTADSGGTIRFSLGPFNTEQQLSTVLQAAAEIAEASVQA